MTAERPTIYVGVVDDDESFARSIGRLLRAVSFQPVTYSSAEEFLADTRRPQFDCLVLDIELGGISGLELQRRLNELGVATPVIFLTAHDDVAQRAAAAACGCAAFLSKIQSGDALIEVITALVNLPPDQAH
jgi:FixJ family two-component response regulator